MTEEKKSAFDPEVINPTSEEDKTRGVRGLNKRAVTGLAALSIVLCGVFYTLQKRAQKSSELSEKQKEKQQLEQDKQANIVNRNEALKRARQQLESANAKLEAKKRKVETEQKRLEQLKKLKLVQPQPEPKPMPVPKPASVQADDPWAKARASYKQQIAQKYYAERAMAYDERLRARRAPMFFFGGGKNLQLDESSKKQTTKPSQAQSGAKSSGLMVRGGTIIEVVLYTGLDSQLKGMVLGLVTKPVWDKTMTQVVIPAGSKVLGTYSSQTKFVQSRMQVTYNSLLLPDGRTIGLGGLPGVDLSGATGYSAKVDQHLDKKFTAAALAALIGAATAAVNGPVNQFQIDPKQSALSGGVQPIQATVSSIAAQYARVAPTLTIDAGARAGIMVTKDLSL